MQCWRQLSTVNERARFAEIMRLMDQRYGALSSSELARWLEQKERNGKNPELFGWFEGDRAEPADIWQVMAITSSKDENGRRTEVGLSMLGIAADVIPQAEWTAENIKSWLARFLIGVKGITGLGEEFRAIRPKTMTWQPVERMHDLMKEGIHLQSDDPAEGILHAGVCQEKDIGHALYWKMRILPAQAIQPNDLVVDCMTSE